jgi:hypothetical protein
MSSKDLVLTGHAFDPDGYWSCPVDKMLFLPIAEDLELFDQNGYDLTELEKRYAWVNDAETQAHRAHRTAIKHPWFNQTPKRSGALLNHSLLFERKAYTGAALDQLKYHAQRLPLIHKIIAMRPKWGLDFSMDWVDDDGNAFEVLHWEYDCFDCEEAQSVKKYMEPRLLEIDWDDAGQQLLKKKDQWHHLGFFEQSDWKCNYFGIVRERFKMVSWS